MIEHPLWKNTCTRIAIICMLLLAVPLNIAHGCIEFFLPTYVGYSAAVDLVLLAIAIAFMVAGACQIEKSRASHAKEAQM